MSNLGFDLVRMGFVDGERAKELVTALDLPAEQVAELARVADPDGALAILSQFGPKLLDVLSDETARKQLFALIGSSSALGEFLLRHPNLLKDFGTNIHPGSFDTSHMRALFSAAETTIELRVVYKRLLLRIVVCDVLEEIDFEQTSNALAELAGATLQRAYELANIEVPNSANTKLAIIAMGKSGGRELNYQSDVDVIFAAEPVADTPTEEAIAIATKVASRVMRICSERTAEGAIWEVDANLRPEGKSGPLVRTVGAHVQYYERWAETWEFQALLKARFVAGDSDVGEQYINAIKPMVWQSSTREDFVGQVRRMRGRVIEHIPSAEVDREIKLGPGGLRDVEFAVQLLQLVHGRADESLRSVTTLPALRSLIDGGYVGRTDGATLAAAYEFLRVLENRIQVFQLRRTHLLPDDETELRRLARGMGMRSSTELLDQWNHHRVEVRRLHEKLFYRPLLEAVAAISTDEMRLTTQAAKDRLSALGYADPAGALTHLEALTSGVTRRAAIQKALLPAMLQWFSDSPNPDSGLLAFRKISDELGTTHWFLKKLRDESEGAQQLAQVLASSVYVADLLIRAPESVSIFGDDDELQPRTLDQLLAEMQSAVKRHQGSDAIAAVRRVRRRELLRIAVCDVLGRLTISQSGIALTELTIATLEASLAAVSKGIETQLGKPLPMRMAIVLMGRVGGYEAGYGSDADVMFIYEPIGDEQEAHEAALSVAVELRRALAEPGPDPALEIDADLRPEGRNGPLVRSLASYRSYYERWSATWEAQALLRANPVVGDKELCQKFTHLINPLRWPVSGLSAEEVKEIRRIKARVESERLPRGADPATHLKLGRGGIADVEWAVQYLQMQHAHSISGLRTTSTLQALHAAREAQLISEADAHDLEAAWLLVSTIRDGIVLLRAKPSDLMLKQVGELAGLAHLLGEGSDKGQDLRDRYLRVTRLARKAFERVFLN